ncbi:MAG: Flp1 family type IVb pilin [Lachnospiraceae bacterium]
MTTEKDVLQEAVVPQESGEEQETGMKSFLRDERGIGVIEIILILVILIGLVLLFKNQITEIVNNAFGKISSDATSILK